MYFKYVFQLLVFQLLHNTVGETILTGEDEDGGPQGELGVSKSDSQACDARIVIVCANNRRRCVVTDKPVAAICHGPWMLCSAKCIHGRRLTSFVAVKDDVENAGLVQQQ